MTKETYERAEILRNKINHFHDVQWAIKNSSGKYLKVIGADGKIINEVLMNDESIVESLSATIDECIRLLEEEFASL